MNVTRLDLLKALTDTLRGITPANGFLHDLSDPRAVQRGRLIFGDKDPDTMLSIVEPPTSPEQLEAPRGVARPGLTSLPLLIQGWVPDTFRNPTDPAYRLLADTMRRLYEERGRKTPIGRPDILGLGSAVDALNPGRGIVRPPGSEVSDGAFFWLILTIDFAETFDLRENT